MKQELTAGPVVLRVDFMLVIAATAAVVSVRLAACLFLTVALHELGHAVAARWLTGDRFRVLLHLSGGRVYAGGIESRPRRALVLLAGPVASGLLVVIGARMTGFDRTEAWGLDLFYCALIWTGYQLAPYPPLDGGHLLRMALEGRITSATWLWRISWLLGFAYAAAIVAVDNGFLVPAIWLTGMAALLGRGEAGYVRHLDAWNLWERGDHRGVVKRALAVPEYLDRRDRIPILALGVTAALEAGDRPALEELCSKLPAHEPAVIEAATWLLTRGQQDGGQASGAKMAERALDALDAERIKRTEIDRERWSEMAFRLAVYEAEQLRPESALGLLERSLDLGYTHQERIEVEPAFVRMTEHPRWLRIMERLSSR